MKAARRAAIRTTLGVVAAVVLLVGGWKLFLAVAPSFDIPQAPTLTPPREFLGLAAEAKPVRTPSVPQHPYMAPNDASVIHADGYMTDTHAAPGPLGRDVETDSTYYVGECATVAFDAEGRIVTLCVRIRGRFLALLDPVTLERLATFDLPPRKLKLGGLFNDFSGGGYFFLDHQGRVVVPTTSRHVFVVGITPETEFEVVHDIDLTAVVGEDDSINSVLTDWRGNLWFVTTDGIVGMIPRGGGAPRVFDTGEGIENSFAVDETGGVYVVTSEALYRFEAGPGGEPRSTWRETYLNDGVQKPGQTEAGSGTTPTLLGSRWVAIADNASHLGVVVYRREEKLRGNRVVCREPVFEPGRGATENSLIGAGRSFVIENNYGYEKPSTTFGGGSTEPGIARVDVDRDGSGCTTAWTTDVSAPSVVPKLSLETGLVYTYAKPPGASTAPWYLTALDFRTGEIRFAALAGRGLGFNNNYAPVTLGPDGSAYVGVLGGLVRLVDAG